MNTFLQIIYFSPVKGVSQNVCYKYMYKTNDLTKTWCTSTNKLRGSEKRLEQSCPKYDDRDYKQFHMHKLD